MECCICYESASADLPFVPRACQCRGTQQWIHDRCLKSWIRSQESTTCSVCQHSLLPDPKPQPLPRAWWILGSSLMDWAVLALYGFLFQSLPPPQFITTSLFVQRVLLGLYIWSYIPLLRVWYTDRAYWMYWFYPLLRDDQGHQGTYIPLVYTLTIALAALLPNVLLFVTPLRQIWIIHQIIVGRLEQRRIA